MASKVDSIFIGNTYEVSIHNLLLYFSDSKSLWFGIPEISSSLNTKDVMKVFANNDYID